MSDEHDASSSSSLVDAVEISHSRKLTVKSYGISIDSSKIHEVAYEEQPESLRELGVNVFDQDVFEEGVLQQVDEAIAAQEEALEKQRLEKDLKAIEEELRITEHKINKTIKNQQANKLLVLDHEKLVRKKEHILQRLCITKGIQEPIINSFNEECTAHPHERKESEISDKDSAERLLQKRDCQETEVERLIRLGEMTPFGNTVDNGAQMDNVEVSSGEKKGIMVLEKRVLALNSQFEDEARQCTSEARTGSLSLIKSCADVDDNDDDVDHDDSDYNFLNCFDNEENYDDVPQLESDDDYIPDDEELKLSWEEDVNMSEHKTTHSEENIELSVNAKKKKKHKSKTVKKTRNLRSMTKDDGDDILFQKRTRETQLKKILWEKGIDYSGKSDEEEEFWDKDIADEEFIGGLKIPGAVWNKLFRYQKTGVKWLWELHCQQAGGIVGDEMGLGKTIQLIAFLAGLKYSKIGRRTSKKAAGLGPVLIVCPATVMYQWVAEFHKWWPEFRVAVLHDIGSYQGPKDALINKIRNAPGVLITTYSGVRLNQEHLLPSRWDYVILDEGHTIRNPDAAVTLACKQFRTPHRIVLSGSPMQNNLRELWSLFDFVFPGKLGTLPVFMQEFSVPITMGGYANATQVQVQTAYKCACVLRDTINPYLLRRLKKDVKMKLDLPNKNEQVLFCRLSEEQTEIYKEYLASREVGSILSGSMKVFAGLIMLRKICNHPDLTTEAGSLWKLRKDQELAKTCQATGRESDGEYGSWKRSGKLVVVQSLLKLWKKQKHKVLLFTQTRQMLKIFEVFVKSQGYEYCRMDGSTSISSRQPLIEMFNKDKSIFVFLLTTRVGGLGVNLVGANRVIIYDPDWNPGIDMQAKERAWRIGQKKDVTIYRLLTTGTIEEKIYHRQIFKQFLTNRVLKDPKQRRFFKSNDLFELFTLDTSDNTKTGTETAAIFAGLGCEVQVPSLQRKLKGTKRKNTEQLQRDSASVLKMMKEKTQEILKTQFSRSKETVAQPSNDEPRKNEMNKDNAVSSRDNSCMGLSGLPISVSCDVPTVSTCTPGSTVDSDGMTKYNESMTRDLEDGVRRETSGNVCLAQLPAEGSTRGGLCDIRGTGSNPELNNVARTQTFSEKLEENNLDIEDAGKMKKLDQSSSVQRKKDKGKMRKKSKKKKKRNKIEGIRIGHLSHSEPYVSKKDSEDGHDDDHYILRKLFKKSGVHSALQHDTIVNSGNSDDILVENEAKRVAAQAVEALKRSRERCMLHRSSGLPTWTGQSGFVGSPHGVTTKTIFGPKAKQKTQCKEDDTSEHFSGESLLGKVALDDETKATSCSQPMSSTQLLARMRSRNFIAGNNAGSEAPSTEQKYEQTMAEVRSFIATRCSRPGMATTREILEEFSTRLPVSDSAIFRAMLRTICDFDRRVSGEGYWVLKAEFSRVSGGPLTGVHEDNLAELGAT